jgi:hypothetical protein
VLHGRDPGLLVDAGSALEAAGKAAQEKVGVDLRLPGEGEPAEGGEGQVACRLEAGADAEARSHLCLGAKALGLGLGLGEDVGLGALAHLRAAVRHAGDPADRGFVRLGIIPCARLPEIGDEAAIDRSMLGGCLGGRAPCRLPPDRTGFEQGDAPLAREQVRDRETNNAAADDGDVHLGVTHERRVLRAVEGRAGPENVVLHGLLPLVRSGCRADARGRRRRQIPRRPRPRAARWRAPRPRRHGRRA